MNTDIRDKISDYEENRDEIEKWLSVKGEGKYSVFLNILENKKIKTTWDNVSGLYRYDKRLQINNFKYLSFFEEYCRAWLIREHEASYDDIEKLPLGGLIGEMTKFGNLSAVFGFENPDIDLDNVRLLRNTVSHNRIMLMMENCDYETAVQSLYNLLPETHRKGYVKDLENCRKGIPVSESFGYVPG